MDLGFTGTSRGLTVRQHAVMHAQLVVCRQAGFDWLHHGDCVEADAAAHAVWQDLGGLVWLHPPLVTTKRAFCRGADFASAPEEFLSRNRKIVGSVQVLMACPDTMEETVRSGTWSTVRRAREVGMRIILILPDGTVDVEPPTRLI